jgi:ParB-like chromosome segregation protein Spo0J
MDTIDALVERVEIGRLVKDPRNARLHPERNMEAIVASLKRFGQQRPIVAQRDGTVLAGNGVLAGALALGWTDVIVRWTDLTGADAMAYALADNRSSELAEWDFPALKDQLQELDTGDFDMTATGWNDKELEFLMTVAAPPDEFATVDENIDTQHRCPKCGYEYSGGKGGE